MTESRAVPTAVDRTADHALLAACRAVLAPLARLAVARGLRYAQIDELLRAALVDAARDAHPDIAANRSTSRVSAATGLHRREVARFIQAPQNSNPPVRRSLATELFTRWLSDSKWHRKGKPTRALPRQGSGKSFETLAQSVTKDVHPRTLLEEMSRLGLARLDEESDTVHLLRESFVPVGDEQRMLAFVASNVGDHLSASVENLLGPQPRHLEQALFADELSSDSIGRLQPMVRERWQSLLRDLAPAMQALIDDDEAQQRCRDQRLRVGMYAFSAPMTMPIPKPQDEPPARPERRKP